MSQLNIMYDGKNYFYGHGKLLLTGEYFVLDGALALALPTTLGQSLTIQYKQSYNPKLTWKSYDYNGAQWFEAVFDFWHFNILDGNNSDEAKFLQKVLVQARKQNPHFLRDEVDVIVETKLEFPLNWGLGSSSTLIYNIAQWAYVSPFELLFKTTGGSGYDIACAQADGPVFYEKKGAGPVWSQVNFDPSFTDNLYFIYLGKKQNSENAIKFYRERVASLQNELVIKLSNITKEILNAKTLEDFEFYLSAHENIISMTLDMPRAQQLYFKDYWGVIKSLGAWGGDFVLATSKESCEKTKNYFSKLGFDVFIPYREMIKTVKKEETKPEGTLFQ